MLEHSYTAALAIHTLQYFSWKFNYNKPHFPSKRQAQMLCKVTHALHKMHFGNYQASSAALRWWGDRDSYLMHKMQSGGSNAHIIILSMFCIIWYCLQQSSRQLLPSYHTQKATQTCACSVNFWWRNCWEYYILTKWHRGASISMVAENRNSSSSLRIT